MKYVIVDDEAAAPKPGIILKSLYKVDNALNNVVYGVTQPMVYGIDTVWGSLKKSIMPEEKEYIYIREYDSDENECS